MLAAASLVAASFGELLDIAQPVKTVAGWRSGLKKLTGVGKLPHSGGGDAEAPRPVRT